MVAYLRHSIIVVLPLPLWPTMTVTGEKNSMTEICLSSKDRMPRIASLLRLAIGTEGNRCDELEGDNRDACGVHLTNTPEPF